MKKITFLDIDGVMNGHNAPKYHSNSIFPECANFINEIIEKTGCDIVIISNWAQDLPYVHLTKLLYSRGIKDGSIIDAIKQIEIDDPSVGIVIGIVKDQFIKEYIEKYSITQYVIIDDGIESSILDLSKLIKPVSSIGMTEKDKNKAIEILNS